ncbi:retrovirus-related pol polyprotein from transposon TNT 1-94 [Tanacetum coccineum]|uniref:Retrovirus-related pol polyprotein from transposon TNT 1-94 n=1 Tax=Tanacetum coccineum TaxID=301880 RepID=A0ABQ5AG18_9ASTR
MRFRNDQFAHIIGYEDLVQGNVTIKMVCYVEGLNHNLFSVGQLCDADLEVKFRKSTCFVRDLQGNDLLTSNRRSDLYIIALQESSSPTPICFMAKASPSQAWAWYRRLSHLNFDIINLLSKNDIVNDLPKLKNGYLRKGRKTKPKRQNRTRNGKAWKRHSQVQAQVSKSQPKSTPTNPEVNK